MQAVVDVEKERYARTCAERQEVTARAAALASDIAAHIARRLSFPIPIRRVPVTCRPSLAFARLSFASAVPTPLRVRKARGERVGDPHSVNRKKSSHFIDDEDEILGNEHVEPDFVFVVFVRWLPCEGVGFSS